MGQEEPHTDLLRSHLHLQRDGGGGSRGGERRGEGESVCE